jgi:hypothetical protein
MRIKGVPGSGEERMDPEKITSLPAIGDLETGIGLGGEKRRE